MERELVGGPILWKNSRFWAMPSCMPDWINNPQAPYVFAAYAAAAGILAGLLILSLHAGRKRRTEWQRMREKRAKVTE
jgi:heme exporter protein CcmD